MTPKTFWDKDGYLYEVCSDPLLEGWVRVVFDPTNWPSFPDRPWTPIEEFEKYKPFVAAC